MQDFTTPPNMSSPYTPVGGNNVSAQPSAPSLGPQIPGTTGGLPAKPGLSVMNNPMAAQFQSQPNSPQQSAMQTQSYGRGQDSMLVHMTPEEVNSLRGLAQKFGGDLTTNPHTGLPEAGWLGKLLPTILGGIGMAFGIPPVWMGAIGAVGGTAITGDLKQGLLAGLGAFGGASLAGSLGVGAASGAAEAAGSAVGSTAADVGTEAATQALTSGTLSGVGDIAATAGGELGSAVGSTAAGLGEGIAQNALISGATGGVGGLGGLANIVSPEVTGAGVKTGLGGVLQRFGDVSKTGLHGTLAKYAPYAAGMGLFNAVSDATQPTLPTYDPEADKNKSKYVPMVPAKRNVYFQTPEQMRDTGGAEFTYFDPSNPAPVPASSLSPEERALYGYAEGGTAEAGPKGLGAISTPAGFEDLVAYFRGTSPGAITASMYPVATPAATKQVAGEQTYNFKKAAGTAGTADTTGATGVTNTTSGYPFTGADMGMVGGNVPFAGYRPLDPIPAAPTFNYLSDQPDFGANMSDADKKFIADNEAATKANIQSVWGPGGFLERQGTLGSVAGAPAVQDAAPVLPAGKGGNVASGATPGANYTNGGFSGYFGADGTFNGSGPSGPLGGPQMGMTPPTGTPNTNLDGSPVAVYDYGAQAAPVAAPNYDYADMSAYSPYNFDFGNFSMPYARGGEVNMGDGSFVMDARAVSELGNGSSNAGREVLARMGGRPLNGPGDGVSDSIPARIGGKQEARVARDEVIFPPQAVARIGGGSEQRGTQKLYALMNRAHKARKGAKRGQDTKLAKGLGTVS